jgi:S1/P1 Nuclease
MKGLGLVSSRVKRSFLSIIALTSVAAFGLLCPLRGVLGWGHEGHQVIGLIAEHYMTGAALAKAADLLGGATIDSVASWADDYRRDHPETGPWHYINVPLAETKIDLARECPNDQCVIAETERFLLVLRDPKADKAAKAEALKFIVHFVGDLHQPLHDENNGDKGGNERSAIFDGRPDNLHWVWDTGLLEDVNRNPRALAAELEQQITPQDRAEWVKGSIEDWVLEGHRLAQSIAYGDLPAGDPAPITSAYQRQADTAIELQLERAAVRLAYLLDGILK